MQGDRRTGVRPGGMTRHRLLLFWRALVVFLFPSRCAACRSLWCPPNSAAGGVASLPAVLGHARGVLCPDCLADCQVVRSPMCSRCGLMFKSRRGVDHRCSDCLGHPGHYDRARAVGIYERGLMALVHQLKYRGRLALVPAMAHMLGTTYRRHWHSNPVDLMLPVPLHSRRLRRRGFNQADLLLRAWLESTGGEAGLPKPERCGQALVRTRATPPQTGLNRRERRRNIRGAFRVVAPHEIQKKRLLLVDDVFTTGATVEEAARVLLAAGARSVDVLTFARTLR